jgi:hypothetical protein
MDRPDPREPDDLTPSVRAKPRLSFRGGPDAMGLVGRVAWTVVIALIGLGIYMLSRSVADWLGTSGLALVLLIVAVYVLIAGIVLWGVWKPGRIDDPTARPQLTAEEREAMQRGAPAPSPPRPGSPPGSISPQSRPTEPPSSEP